MGEGKLEVKITHSYNGTVEYVCQLMVLSCGEHFLMSLNEKKRLNTP